jgi:TonB family protein
MPDTYEKMLAVKQTVGPAFSILLLILLTFSMSVRAQQSQSSSSPIEQKQTALKAGEKHPSSNFPKDADDSHDPKLAVYQVHRLAEKILALRSVRAKGFEIARLAAVLWKQDESHARFLFEKALNLTTANGNDSEGRALSTLHRRVIALIARTDAEWASRLIDSAARREGQDQGSKTLSTANIRTALSLLEEDSVVATQFAERSIKGGIASGFLDFVLTLRKQDEAEANRLFLQALNHLSQQPAVNIAEFHLLGLYLFTAPDLIDSDYHKVTLVDQILVPNITAERAGVPKTLVRAYLATAADVLWRMTPDAEQRKHSYALCYMLWPKSKTVAPDLTAKLEAVMAALAPEVPAELTKDSAYRYTNQPPTTIDEKLANAENRPDQEGRDIAYLEIALQAWRKGDFTTARVAQGRLSDLEASQRLAVIIDFGDGAWAIKQKDADLSRAEAMANRLPQGIERSILVQAIAKFQGKGRDKHLTEETVDKALKAARSMSDSRRPFLLLAAAAQFADLKSPAVHSALAEAVKDFNAFEEPSLTGLDWAQTIQIGPMNARFPLDVADVHFSFSEAFRSVALADPEAAMARADELRSENLRAQGFVEVGRAFLDRVEPKERKQNEQAIRVGEDGMRKSASKTVMPAYPNEALKKREQGVAVVELQYDAKGDVVSTSVLEAPSKSIGDAVVVALKQWKFVPSRKQDGTPVSVRGKLTFYFEIDKEGKGRVQNPKQFR